MAVFDPVANGPRRIVSLGVRSLAGFRIKVYGFAYGAVGAREELVEASLAWSASHLSSRPTARAHHGVGFLGANDGNGFCQVFIDLWVEQNELHHYIRVADKGSPTELREPPTDFNSVCVWDLAIQCHEREAWVRHVLRNPNGPDVEAYLRDFLDKDV